MTTAASFPSLHAPLATEDSMEMSSPAQPSYDDDIDIDFEEHVGGVELTDDERMADDVEQPRPGTATDDMMEDDDAPSHDAQAPEQEMEDGFDAAAYEQADPDDELIDYGEDDFQEMGESNEQAVYEPPAPEITLEDREPTVDPEPEQADEVIVREPEASVPVPEIVVAEEPVAEVAPTVPDTTEEPAVPHDEEAPSADAPNDETEHQAVAAKDHTEGDVAAAVESPPEDDNNPMTPHEIEPFPELPEDSPEQIDVAPVPAPLDTNVEASVDAPGTPTDTGLHPMMIQYGDWEWPLFKSSRQPEGLVKDDNLASVALADLLNNCRSRLALKAGEDISKDQEFVLRFDSTGLTIVENSPSAFSTSLEEILEVFKQLHVNDGAQSIPPFWLYLSLQPKPSSYLTMLKQAAAGGQGISSFVDVPAEEEVPEHYGEYYQDGDEDPTLLGEASGVDYEDHPHNDGEDVAAQADLNETDYHEYDTSYENTEGGQQEAQEGYEQYEQYEDAGQAEYEDYGEGEETNTPAAHVENPENVQNFEETADLSRTDATDAPVDPHGKPEESAVVSSLKAVEEDEVHAGEGEGEEQGEGSNVESVASSTTLRADQANDAVGEYKDEDLIDWDDSILTSDLSEHGTDDNDDFSTFLTEPDLEEAEGQATDGNHVANEVFGHDATAAAAEDDAASKHHEEDTDLQASGRQAAETHSEANGLHSFAEAQKQNGASDTVEAVAGESVGVDSLEAQPSENTGAKAKQIEDQAPEVAGSPRKTSQVPDDQHEHPVEEPAHNDEDYIDFGEDENEDLVFDDDTYEQHEARKASQANSPGSQSPTSKRPLDEIDGTDLNDQPDLKKVKSS